MNQDGFLKSEFASLLQSFENFLKSLRVEGIIMAEIIKFPHDSYSLPLQPISPKKLAVPTFWNVF